MNSFYLRRKEVQIVIIFCAEYINKQFIYRFGDDYAVNDNVTMKDIDDFVQSNELLSRVFKLHTALIKYINNKDSQG